jgi:hypothetical protein
MPGAYQGPHELNIALWCNAIALECNGCRPLGMPYQKGREDPLRRLFVSKLPTSPRPRRIAEQWRGFFDS